MAHIRYAGPEAVLDDLVNRYPILTPQKEDIQALYELVRQSFASGGKLLVLGNGGSAADALHIVGELMKSFTLPAPSMGRPPASLARASARRANGSPPPWRARCPRWRWWRTPRCPPPFKTM